MWPARDNNSRIEKTIVRFVFICKGGCRMTERIFFLIFKYGIVRFIIFRKKMYVFILNKLSYPRYFILMLKAINCSCMTRVTFEIIICHTLSVDNMHFKNILLLVGLESKVFSCRLKLVHLYLNTFDTCFEMPVSNLIFSPEIFPNRFLGNNW